MSEFYIGFSTIRTDLNPQKYENCPVGFYNTMYYDINNHGPHKKPGHNNEC